MSPQRDAPSAGGSEDLEDLWQGRSRPFRLQRQLSLPNLLFEGRGPTTGLTSSFMHSPDRPASTGRQACQGTGSQGAIGGPLVEEPTLVVLSQANGTIWHPRPELWALYLWPLNGSLPASQSEC